MAFQEMNMVSLNPGARQLTDIIDTNTTGAKDGYWIPPYASNGVGITLTALSTAVVKLQATTDSAANVLAGTALWADLPAPFASVTGGAVVQGTVNYGITAIRPNVTTLLAGRQATIALATQAPIKF